MQLSGRSELSGRSGQSGRSGISDASGMSDVSGLSGSGLSAVSGLSGNASDGEEAVSYESYNFEDYDIILENEGNMSVSESYRAKVKSVYLLVFLTCILYSQ